PRPRRSVRRPDPGRRHRPQPRSREVRLAEGLQVLDLRHLVDPPGRAAISRRTGADDPRADARARASTDAEQARAEARDGARPATDREGTREVDRPEAAARRRGALGPRGASLAPFAR